MDSTFFKAVYFQSSPINAELKKMVKSLMVQHEGHHQKLYLYSTVKHPISLRFPPCKQYRQAFLKCIITELEEVGAEIIDEMYETYTALLSEPEESNDSAYKTYFIGKEFFVVLKESTHFISQGTTGLCTWQAAKYLTEWLWGNKHILKNRNVLELGSGLGLPGLVTLKCCSPASFIFTDCHPEVLKMLLENIEINTNTSCSDFKQCSQVTTSNACEIPPPSPKAEKSIVYPDLEKSVTFEHSDEYADSKPHPDEESTLDIIEPHSEVRSGVCSPHDECNLGERHDDRGCATCARRAGLRTEALYPEDWLCTECGRPALTEHRAVFNLHWEEVEGMELEQLGQHLNVILASDVVYDPRIIPSLVKTLTHLLVTQTTVAYVASTVRNEETNYSFLQALSDSGLHYEKIESPRTELCYYDRTVPVDLVKIRTNVPTF